MKNSVNLSLALLLLLLFSSCGVQSPRGFYAEPPIATKPIKTLRPLLNPEHGIAKYNLSIDFRKQNLSGMLLIHQESAGVFRMLFSSFFGLSIFDLTITQSGLQINHCIEPLQNKKLLRLLERDFALLLGIELGQANSIERFIHPQDRSLELYLSKALAGKAYYLKTTDCPIAQQVIFGTGIAKGVIRNISPPCERPSAIELEHPWLKLRLFIEVLEEQELL